MKRELGIARCGLACCLCSENVSCPGCRSDGCGGKSWCVNRRCSIEKGLDGCFDCSEDCRKGLLAKTKPYTFTQFARRFGRLRQPGCTYLVTGIGAPTAARWYPQLREAVDTLDARQKRMRYERFFKI